MSIEFDDGYGQHYVRGRFIEPEIFNACSTIEGARTVFFREDNNEDIKSIIAFIIRDNFGQDGLMEMLEAKLYKEAKVKHNDYYTEILRLYRTKEKFNFLRDSNGVPNQPFCWLEYICPSTGTIFLIDTFADYTDPVEASKHHRPEGIPHALAYQWSHFAN